MEPYRERAVERRIIVGIDGNQIFLEINEPVGDNEICSTAKLMDDLETASDFRTEAKLHSEEDEK